MKDIIYNGVGVGQEVRGNSRVFTLIFSAIILTTSLRVTIIMEKIDLIFTHHLQTYTYRSLTTISSLYPYFSCKGSFALTT